VCVLKTETKLIDYSKLIDNQSIEINRLNEKIKHLVESKETLMTQLDSDKTKIEDLEFQIEEHKLGCAATASNTESTTAETLIEQNNNKQQQTATDDEQNILLKQLQLQKDICKNHIEENKFLKEQIDVLNIDLKQLRLGEEVYTQDKQELKKSLNELETRLNKTITDLNEEMKLKLEQIKVLETQVQKFEQENVELKKMETIQVKLNAELADLKVKLGESENQKSDIEFLNEENNVKLSDMNNRINDLEAKLKEKIIEINTLRMSSSEKETDVEFALEEQKVLVHELEVKLANFSSDQLQEKQRLENELKTFKDLCDKIEKEKAELDSTKTSQINELEQKLDELTADFSISKNQANKLTESLEAKQNELEQLDQMLKQIQNEKDDQIEKLTTNLTATVSESLVLKEKLENKTIEHGKLVQELNDLKIDQVNV
jgi:chromosome segregation ATPase